MDQQAQQIIGALQERVALLAEAQNQQQQRMQEMQLTQFRLTPDQIIKNFNAIPLFSGEDSYKLRTFLKNVEQAEQLCGEQNFELRTYCLSKVIHGRIIGRARAAILRIPDRDRTWDAVVSTLTQQFKPKTTVHQLLFQARAIKVFNLKDLFNKLTNIESQANEICDYNNGGHDTYDTINKELVQIAIDHLTPLMQIHINDTLTLNEIDHQLSRTELYYSEDAIKHVYRVNKNYNSHTNYHLKKSNYQHKPQTNPQQNGNHTENPQHYTNINNHNQQNRNRSLTQHQVNLPERTNQSGTFTNQFSRNQVNYNTNTHNQNTNQNPFNQNRSEQFRNYNNRQQPMEIDNIAEQNIHHGAEINFQ